MKKLVLFLFVCLFSFNLFAQETVVFQTNKSATKSKSSKESSHQNIIKIAPLSFISGFVPVFYERNINDFISIQAGVGITTKNYILDAIGDAGADNNGIIEKYKKLIWADGNTSNSYFVENSTYGGEARTTAIGYIISVEPRLYFNNEAPEGGFIGLNLSQRRNNYTSKTVSSTPTNGNIVYTGGTTKEFDNLSTVMVNFGNQVLYDNLTLEYAAGIGLRKIKGEHYIYASGNNGKYVSGTGIIDRSKVAFDISFKIGYHF